MRKIGAYADMPGSVEIRLEGGPFAGRVYQIDRETYDHGWIQLAELAERAELLASADLDAPTRLTMPTMHIYQRRTWTDGYGGRYARWIWVSRG